MIFVQIAAIIVSFLITLYVGKRWQFWFKFQLTGIGSVFYWITLFLVGFSLVLSRLLGDLSSYWIPLIGSIIFGIFICAFYILIIFDILYLISFKKFRPNLANKIIYIICTVALFIYGNDQAINPKIVKYQVKIDKPAKQEKLRIVQLTDIHISEIVTPQFIQQMVDKVNRLNADLVVITGDTIDSRIDPFILLGFNKQFQQLKAKYGTYIIFGNHEYASIDKPNNSLENIATAYKSANMHLLKDDVLYDDKLGITLIGRNDYITEKLKTARASLDDLLLFTDPDAPIILLDHQPQDLNEPAEKGVDLMISGHTHGGQIFPVNLVVDYLYKNPHGIYVDPNHKFTSIVSSGYGLWGPPIRLMTRCEIVVIDLTFDKQADTLNKGEN